MAKYADIRWKIKTGDLFFTRSPRLFSRSIRAITRSDISHVWVFFWEGNRLKISEMLEWKNCRVLYASDRFKKEMFFWWRPHEKNATDIEIMDYSYHSASAFQYSVVRAMLSIFIPSRSKRKEICSEFAAACTNQKFPALNRWIIPIDLVGKCNSKTFISVTQ